MADRKAYMREYMRNRRKQARGEQVATTADAATVVSTVSQALTTVRENAASSANITNNMVLTEDRYRAIVQEEIKAVLGPLREIIHEEVALALTERVLAKMSGNSPSERYDESPRPSHGPLPHHSPLWTPPPFPKPLATTQTTNRTPLVTYSDSKIGRQRHGLESLVNLEQGEPDS